MAEAQGQVTSTLAGVLFTLLEAADDHLHPTWWSLAYIARLVLGEGRYGDDPAGGQRTAGKWMAELGRLGWVERQHRFVVEDGGVRGTSNLWRFTIPPVLRQAVQDAEDAGRRANAGRRPKGARTSKAPQNRRGGPERPVGAPTPPPFAQRDLARQAPCPACGGDRFVAHPNGGVIACAACDARGHITRPPP